MKPSSLRAATTSSRVRKGLQHGYVRKVSAREREREKESNKERKKEQFEREREREKDESRVRDRRIEGHCDDLSENGCNIQLRSEEQAANLRHTVYRLESELGHQRAIAMAAGPECAATLKLLS